MMNRRLNYREKLFAIPGIVLVFFILILILTLINNSNNQKQNLQVSQGYCPAYTLSRDMKEQLITIQIKLQQAVSTLELDALQEADNVRDSFLQMIDQGMKNPVQNNQELETLREALITYYTQARRTTEQMINGDLSDTVMEDLKVMANRYNELEKKLEANRAVYETEMNNKFENIRSNNDRSLLLMILLITLSMMLSGIITYWIATTMTRNLNAMVDMMKDIAQGEGDLTRRMVVKSTDELGDLANWFNLFVEKLHAIINQVRANTIQVSGAVAMISSTAAQMAAGAEGHNSQAGEVSASVEEMTASIMQNSQNAGQTARIAEEAGNQVRQGVETMQTSKTGIERIVTASQKMEDIVKSLTNRALQIGEITRVIDKIADQTNLLALNAAVEAARAGEQGSGFAVVADEVRKLAERTVTATREIGETIESIQKDTVDASESMMETKDAVISGQRAMEQTETVLTQILDSVNMAVDMIQQIAAASEEQSAGAEEISSAVEEMNAVSKQTSEGAEQMSAAAQELNAQTEILKNLVDHFKLNARL